MSRNRNARKITEPPKPRAHETVSNADRTDESVVRRVEHDEAPRTLPSGFPLAGSEVLEAVGSNGTIGRAMHDVLHAPDDEKVLIRLGPEQEASIAFCPDEALGDAGAEFAAEFGRDFLVAVTTGEDFSEVYNDSATEISDTSEPYIQDAGMSELEDLTEFAEPVEDEVPPSR